MKLFRWYMFLVYKSCLDNCVIRSCKNCIILYYIVFELKVLTWQSDLRLGSYYGQMWNFGFFTQRVNRVRGMNVFVVIYTLIFNYHTLLWQHFRMTQFIHICYYHVITWGPSLAFMFKNFYFMRFWNHI